MLFDHCAVCQKCCNVDEGYSPLEITLTASEKKRLGSVCIDRRCEHLGNKGCELGDDKPFGCKLYPLSYDPSEKSFFFDADCPLMDEYFAQLKKPGSEAHTHLSQAQAQITELHKKSSGYLKRNFQVDVEFFDLRPIP